MSPPWHPTQCKQIQCRHCNFHVEVHWGTLRYIGEGEKQCMIHCEHPFPWHAVDIPHLNPIYSKTHLYLIYSETGLFQETSSLRRSHIVEEESTHSGLWSHIKVINKLEMHRKCFAFQPFVNNSTYIPSPLPSSSSIGEESNIAFYNLLMTSYCEPYCLEHCNDHILVQSLLIWCPKPKIE